MPTFTSCDAPELNLHGEQPDRGNAPKPAPAGIERPAQLTSSAAGLDYLPVAEQG